MIKENFIRLFESSIRENWELPAFTDYIEKVTYNYSEVGVQIAKLHILFEQIGIEQGDKISLIGKNGSHWCMTYIASVTYGAVIVPILQDFNPSDIKHIINHSDSKLLIVSDYLWENVDEESLDNLYGVLSLNDFRCLNQRDGEQIQKHCKHLEKSFNEKYPEGYGPEHVLYPTVPNSELACISYTSGTTGFSKGVMLPGNALAGNISFGITTRLLERGSRALAFLPLAHAYGCAFDFLTSFCAGSHTTYLGKVPSPKVLLKAFEEVKPTTIFTVPLIIEKIYRKQIQPLLNSRSMRWAMNVPIIDATILGTIRKKLTAAFGGEFKEVIIGGAPLNPEVEAFFRKIGFKFTIGYGMTECAPLISYTPWDEFKPTSVGKVLPTMEVKIVKQNPNDEVGEICVRGENLMVGYYKNEEATTAVLDEEGWLHTGDMGTADEDGTIYIRGRYKSMLLGPSGQNIYPEEVEAKLNNMPFILESLVLQNTDHKLVAFVYPDYEAVDEAKIEQKDLELIMNENCKNLNSIVASYEQITAIKLYPNEFEKTPKKSIKRYLYVDLLKQQ